jgi:hypothetical protein
MDDIILRALDGTVRPVKKPPLYFLGLFVVTVAMIILPLIYVALIAAVAYFLFLHVTESLDYVSKVGGIYAFLIGYLGPIFIGIVVLFFMTKPLFLTPPKGPKPYTLDPDKQPRLFAFVERLSELVRAPRPRRIDVDVNVNASASIQRDPRCMIISDLVLTIGLPLVEGMSLRQLAGVLAHELGHFSQGGGMRLSYVIRTISAWFARVVYERDNFDVELEKASRGRSLWAQIVVRAAMACVWLGRRILWILMTVGHIISCFLMRQMEYDADRYETRVAGSAEFEGVTRRILMLTVGHRATMEDLHRIWQEHKLPEQLPGLIVATTNQIAAENEEKIWDHRLTENTRWLDTHPSDAERIKSAMAEDEPGLVQIDLPGTALFEDYDEVSNNVTLSYYRDVFGLEISADNLVPTERLVAERKEAADRFAALDRFFQGKLSMEFPAFLSATRVDLPTDMNALKTSIEESRERICDPPPGKADEQKALLRNRLYYSLQLLQSPDTQRAAKAEQLPEQEAVNQKVVFLYEFEQRFLTIRRLQLHFEGMMNLLQSFESLSDDGDYQRELLEKVKDCVKDLERLKEELGQLPYPYEHATKDCSCADYAIPQLPDSMYLNAVVDASGYCLDCMYSLYFRVVAELAAAAEMAETIAGFSVLPAPPPDEQPGVAMT